MINIKAFNLELLADTLPKYVNEWVAVSGTNEIVAHGATYETTIAQVSRPDEVMFLKVPPVDASLAPTA